MKFQKKIFSLTFILSFSIAILYSCSGTSPEYRTYENALKLQIQEMTNVLNAAHYNEFMSKYVDPAYVAKEGGVDQALLQFDNKKQQRLYSDLKLARNTSPLYDDKTREMTYISESLSKAITFKLVDGKWYMTGDWFR